MIDTKLSGKNVVITGANHGIGAASAIKLAEQGANIFLTYYREQTELSKDKADEIIAGNIGGDELYSAKKSQGPDKIAEIIKTCGVKISTLESNLEIPENALQLIDCAEKEIGPIDILILNHTYCEPYSFDPELNKGKLGSPEKRYNSAKKHYLINPLAFSTIIDSYVEKYLMNKQQKGCIVTISTDAAHAHPNNLSYAASKHAIESLSRTAAYELGKYGIRVNTIAPGPVQTGYISPETEKQIIKGIPLGRVGTPDEVADAIVFLCSEQARWITGQLLYVGGGNRMHQ